ncbi:MAG: flagellar motor protein MotB [Pseudomonadota bacterium]
MTPEAPLPYAVTEKPSLKWGDGNAIALLSLKLLLLAFFILLNALSALEAHKAEAVLESVNKAFSGRLVVQSNFSPQEAAAGNLDGARLMMDEVGQLFESMLPAIYREKTSTGEVLVMELPADSIFKPGKVGLQPGRGLLLDRFVAALNTERDIPIYYEFEFQHGGQGIGQEERDLIGARAASIAQQFVKRGVNRNVLSSGVAPIDSEKLRFVLRIQDVPYGSLFFQPLAAEGQQ